MEPLQPIQPPFEPPPGAELPEERAGESAAEGDVSWGARGSDPDFELLENYLDGELTPTEERGLERRLRVEPELSAALERMSAEYAVRRAVFRSLEPDDVAAEALSDSIVGPARPASRAAPRRARTGWHDRSVRIGRLVGAVAACVALSFCAGWVGRGYAAQSQAQNNRAVNPSDEKDKAEPSVYQVALTDEAGNITAVQKFDNLEEAQSFAADVGRWQARQQQLRRSATVAGAPGPGATAPVPTSSGL